MKNSALPNGVFLRSIRVSREKPWPERFPFNVPLLASLEEITFSTPVTFLVGENGSGKSTLLESIACVVGSITVGSASVGKDPTLAAIRQMIFDFRLTWNRRTRKGFFMRSEDFFGYARQMDQTRAEMEGYLEEIDRDYQGRSQTAVDYARSPYQNELSGMQRRYGEGVDARSHGESYLNLFQARFVPGGLYLLDEPEAPLSPKRQLSFMVLLQSMVAQQAQFIIATHSPILMGFPGASIYNCDSGRLAAVQYEDLEHVYITRDFLNHPKMYLRNLGLSGDAPEEK